MASTKDYYSILGLDQSDKNLPQEEFTKKLKENYRKLCRKWHPDKQQGKSEEEKKHAENMIKDINEAYSILSDPAKKQKYDNPTQGMDFNIPGFDDLFSGFNDDFFGFRSKPKVNKGQSIRITLNVTLEDIYNSSSKQIKYQRKVRCNECNGSGADKDSKIETCDKCGGTGTIISQNGMWQQITTCHHCQGKGKIIKNPCKHCGGSGLINDTNVVSINIPNNVVSGSQIILSGQGSQTSDINGVNGDLLVMFNEIKHDKFERVGNDLYFKIKVKLVDSLLGSDIVVDTIDGRKLKTTLQPCLNHGSIIRFGGHGMPISSNKRGDMLGVVDIELPKQLNSSERELLSKLKEEENFK